MLVHIPAVLTKEELVQCQSAFAASGWVDGKITAGIQSGEAKHNLQLQEGSHEARQLGEVILRALGQNPLFTAAALPLRVFPPLFNRYDEGMRFDAHVDNAIRFVPGANVRVRTDISATLFISEPKDYDGGELVIEDTYGLQRVKLQAGDMVLYPGTSLHKVTPVTRGERIGCFSWIQSLLREDAQRRLMFDLDTSIRRLTQDLPEHPALTQLTGVYHNLLRRWSDT